jgi:hypothetical protein
MQKELILPPAARLAVSEKVKHEISLMSNCWKSKIALES